MENSSTACDKLRMAVTVRDPLNVKIGEAIKAARNRRKIPAREVAEAVGTTVGAVGNWESGQNAIAATNFFGVADFLGIDARALIQGELVYLDDPNAEERQKALARPASPSVVRLWEAVGRALKLNNAQIDQIAEMIEGRVRNINNRREL